MKKPPFPDKICLKPFEYLEIGTPKNGKVDCYSCCPTILPKPTGNLSKNTIEEVWNSDVYKDIRESIVDSSYRFCRHDLCPEIQSENLLDLGVVENTDFLRALKSGDYTALGNPKEINLAYDQTCNLACPSCRRDYITTNSEDNDAIMAKITEDILSRDLTNTKIIACSSGDPFVSKHFRHLLFNLEGEKHPGLEIQLMTNGLMFNKLAWQKLHKVHKNIKMTCVSIDASKPETYAITRRGGNWDTLMENLIFLSLLRERGELSFLRLDFVVQDHNYKEIPEFIALGEKFKVDQVFFQKVANWGTFSPIEYKERQVYNEEHPDFQQFLKVIKSEEMRKPIVNPGNFGHWVGPLKKKHSFNLINAVRHSLRKRWRGLQKQKASKKPA